MANNNHFELALDTTAPTGSITRAGAYLKKNSTMSITKTDSNSGQVTLMKLWFDTKATATKADSGYTAASWEAASTSYTTKFTTDGEYYYHLVLMDSVGNESVVYNTALMVYDTTLPTITNATITDPDGLDDSKTTYTNQLSNTISFNYSDNLSGVVSGRLVCAELTGSPISLTLDSAKSSYSGTINFIDSAEDGKKTVQIYVTDRSGNESLVAETSIILDRALDKPILSLHKVVSGETVPTTALPEYINYLGIKAKLVVSDSIVKYRIWEDGQSVPTWTDSAFTPTDTTPSTTYSKAITLNSTDGTHTIRAEVMDAAGNTTEAVSRSVIVDRVAPTGSIALSVDVADNMDEDANLVYISKITGYNTAKLTVTIADERSGIASYKILVGSTTWKTGTTAASASVFTISGTDAALKEGSNAVKLEITDKAGNTYTSTQALGTIVLDTTKPTVSITALKTWYNAQFALPQDASGADYGSITLADSNDGWVVKYCVWTDTTASGVVPASPTWISSTSASLTKDWPATTAQIQWNLAQSANNYLHVACVDMVGNVSAVANTKFGYDSVVPNKPAVAWTQSAYASATAQITITATDETSGIEYMQISGDITNSTSGWESFVTTKSVTLTSTDGYKKIKVMVKDKAGNVSVWSDEAQTELDTSIPSGTLSLRNKGTTTAKDDPSNIATFDAYITYNDDTIGNGYYKIWGDFVGGESTEAAAQWVEIVPDKGAKALTLSLTCTSGDGQKNIAVRLKDSADNLYPASTTDPLKANFTYDTEAPEVTVTGVDYNRVSKVHINRYNGTSAISNKYCDEINFSFHIGDNEIFKAYKVCAYADQTAAEAGSYEDAAIPTTAGSLNMSKDGISQTGTVSCLLKGADFENALNGGNGTVTNHTFDGAHYVVVYVQDQGGTWSEAANFSA